MVNEDPNSPTEILQLVPGEFLVEHLTERYIVAILRRGGGLLDERGSMFSPIYARIYRLAEPSLILRRLRCATSRSIACVMVVAEPCDVAECIAAAYDARIEQHSLHRVVLSLYGGEPPDVHGRS